MSVNQAQERLDRWLKEYQHYHNRNGKRRVSSETIIKLKNYFTQQVKLEANIKKILGDYSPPTISNPFYHNYGREISSLVQRYKGSELETRMNQVTQKWLSRSLDATILDKIRELVLSQYNILN